MRLSDLLALRAHAEEARSMVHRSAAGFDADARPGAVLLAPDGAVLARRVAGRDAWAWVSESIDPFERAAGRRPADHPLARAESAPWESAVTRDGHNPWFGDPASPPPPAQLPAPAEAEQPAAQAPRPAARAARGLVRFVARNLGF